MKQYCEKCRKETEYSVFTEQLKGRLQGKIYEYMGKVARCNECGDIVFDEHVQDSNLDALYAEYRKENNIISTERVCEILRKYNIFSEDMSMLLGWGENTYTWLCNGDVPSEEFSQQLQRIYDDPKYFLKVLNEGKNRIALFAYRKAEEAAKKILINTHSDMALMN